MKTLQKR